MDFYSWFLPRFGHFPVGKSVFPAEGASLYGETFSSFSLRFLFGGSPVSVSSPFPGAKEREGGAVRRGGSAVLLDVAHFKCLYSLRSDLGRAKRHPFRNVDRQIRPSGEKGQGVDSEESLFELGQRHDLATTKLEQVGEIFVTRNEYVGISYTSQFQQIVVLRVSTTLGNVAKGIVLTAGTEEGQKAVAGFGSEVSCELGP